MFHQGSQADEDAGEIQRLQGVAFALIPSLVGSGVLVALAPDFFLPDRSPRAILTFAALLSAAAIVTGGWALSPFSHLGMVRRYVAGVPRGRGTDPAEWVTALALAGALTGMYATSSRPILYSVAFAVYSLAYVVGQRHSNAQMQSLMDSADVWDASLRERSRYPDREWQQAFDAFLDARAQARTLIREYFGSRLNYRVYAHVAAAIIGIGLTGAGAIASLPMLEIGAVVVMSGTLIVGQAVVWFWNYQRDRALFPIGAPIRSFDRLVEQARAVEALTSMLPRAPR